MKVTAFIIVALLLLFSTNTQAQPAYHYPVQTKSTAGVSKETLTNIDTIYAQIPVVENNHKSIRGVLTKSSGNVSKVKVYLQARYGAAGSDSDGNWDTLDSLSCLNQTTNKKTFALRSGGDLLYTDYRLAAIADTNGVGVQISSLKAYHLKRRSE